MSPMIVHQQRLSWEGARVFVVAARSRSFPWFCERVGQQLGMEYENYLAKSRTRLLSGTRDDMAHVENGLWRVRLEDLLRGNPELADTLVALIRETSDRLPR